MPRRYRFRQVDVFTDRPLTGNPLAVFLDADGLTDDEMQALAREMNLSETAFVLEPSEAGRAEHADYRLRIFTPGMELPFAGHPSIGAAWVLADEGRFPLAPPQIEVRQELAIGVLPLVLAVSDGAVAEAAGTDGAVRDGPGADDGASVVGPVLGAVTMTQGRPELVHRLDSGEVAELCETLEVGVDAIGWKTADGRGSQPPVAVISTGLPHLIVPISEQEVLAELDRERSGDVARFASALGSDSVALIAPGNSGAVPDADVTARIFDAPRIQIEGDPATGAAAGPIAVYLGRVSRTRSATYRVVIEQGVDVGRPSRLVAEADFDADGRPGDVRVSGTAVPVIEGWATLP